MEKLPYKTLSIIDPDTNMDVVLSRYNIYKYFDHVYIICPLNNTTKQMVLYQCDIKLLSNPLHFDNIIYGESDDYKEMNLFGYNMKRYILAIKITNITFLNIQKYLDSISGLNTFDRFYDVNIMNRYFKDNNSKLTDMIKNLECAQYWSDMKNCYINMNEEFSKRRFTHINMKNCNDMKKALNSDYLDNCTTSIPEFNIDIFKRTNCDYTPNDITILFNHLSEIHRNHLFMQLMVSKEYCHLVINNYDIMTMMTKYIEKMIVEVKHRFSYAWLTLYLEELLDKNKIKTNNKYIFDINTAAILPQFYNDDNIYSNPYMTTLISYKKLNYGNNVYGVVSNNCIGRRICTLDEFKERMNIFISGNSEIDLFEGIDFKKLNMGVTGSIMTACTQRYHPLLILFDDNHYKFFEEYYHNADVDIIINKPNIFEFYDTFIEFYTMLMCNVIKNFNIEPDSIDYEVIQSIYVFTDDTNKTDEYAEEMFHKYNNELLIDFSKEEKEIIMKKYPELFKFNYSNVVFKNKKQDNEYYKDVLINYKFKIKCSVLNHNFEVFQCRADDIMNLVGNFHLPCVRAYYNGNVYMTPSFITAHNTYMNIDYRYFAGTAHPCEIINKYRMRGFGTLLNRNELEIYKNYIKNHPKWGDIIGCIIMGQLAPILDIFHPRKEEFRYDDTHYNMNVNIKNYDETAFNSMIYKQAIKLSNICAIDMKTGHIIPFEQ